MLEGSHSDERIEGVDLEPGATVRGAYFEGCVFLRCTFAEAVFNDCRFVDCRLESCDLRMVRFDQSVLANVTLVRCRCAGVDWTRARTMTLTLSFEDCQLDYSNFVGLKLARTRFIESSMREVDLRDTDLRQAVFKGSDLARAIVQNADLSGTDFTDSRNCALDAKHNRFRGTRVELETAHALLSDLGVKVPSLDALLGVD